MSQTIQHTVTDMLAEIEQLRSQLACRDNDFKILELERDRYKEWCTAWRTALETAGTCVEVVAGVDPTAIPEAIRDKFCELRSQLSARESELENLQNKLHTKDEEINCAGLTNDALQAKLAAYDACLRQARGGMPEVENLRFASEQGCKSWYQSDIHTLLAAIESLQIDVAANRKRIAELEQYHDWAEPQVERLGEQIVAREAAEARIAELQSPPEERSGIFARQSERIKYIDRCHLNTKEAAICISDVAALLEDCARWRNALHIHQLDIQRLTAANAEYAKRHMGLTEVVASRDREIEGLLIALKSIAGMTDFAPTNLLKAAYEMQQIAINAFKQDTQSEAAQSIFAELERRTENAKRAEDYRRRVCPGPTGEWP